MADFAPIEMTISGPPAVIEAFLRSYRDPAFADLTKPAPWVPPMVGVIGPIAGTEANQPVLRIGVSSLVAIPVPSGAWLSDNKLAVATVGTWCSLPNTRVKTAAETLALFYPAERIALRAIPELADAIDRVLAQNSCNLDSPECEAMLQIGVNNGAITPTRAAQVLAGVVV
jgi:hypothetical protein